MLLLIIFVLYAVVVIPKFTQLQKLTDKLDSVLRESSLLRVRVTCAYNAEKHQEDKFEKENYKLIMINLSENRVMTMLMLSICFIMSVVSLSIYWVDAILTQNANTMDKIILFSIFLLIINNIFI